MAQTTDLYTILKAYAKKNNSPYIDIIAFLDFLERYANSKAQESSGWATDTKIKFRKELAKLAESEKCVLIPEKGEGRVYMPFFYQEQLRDIYKNIENQSGLPFPDEKVLGAETLHEHVQVINLQEDIGIFFEESESDEDGGNDASDAETEKSNPNQIARIVFPGEYGTALIPVSMIPRRLMEIAFLKMRYYLHSHSNREYMLHKLSPQLQGKEKYVNEILDQLATRPFDCLRGLEDYSGFAYLFWICFCALIKKDMGKKNELLGEDIAVAQAAYIIEACNGFYRAKLVKKRELEVAFRNLELCMEKPPFYFTIDDITKFSNSTGQPLVGLYSQKQLAAHIKKRITEAEGNKLPDWLVLQGSKGERWYIKKNKYLALCAKLLNDTRTEIKKIISKRWVKLIMEFRREPAMDKDSSFEKMLKACTANICPILVNLLDDYKLLLVHEEFLRTQEISITSQIVKDGRLLPLSVLLAVSRKDLLSDARIIAPFWYSLPILSNIIAFFKNIFKGKKPRKGKAAANSADKAEKLSPQTDALHKSARAIGVNIVPKGQTLDEYLEELEGRWSNLLDQKARQNLIEDVRTLVRDSLRFKARMLSSKKIGETDLENMANDIVNHNQTLLGLKEQEYLRLYIEAYLVKLLLTLKL